MRRWRLARRRPAPTCWLVYAGPSDSPDDLTLAAVTGTEREAAALLAELIAAHPGRANMIEDRPYTPAPGAPETLAPGERVTVHVLVTGDDDHQEGREVFAEPAEASARLAELRAHGPSDARLRRVVTNTWLVTL